MRPVHPTPPLTAAAAGLLDGIIDQDGLLKRYRYWYRGGLAGAGLALTLPDRSPVPDNIAVSLLVAGVFAGASSLVAHFAAPAP